MVIFILCNFRRYYYKEEFLIKENGFLDEFCIIIEFRIIGIFDVLCMVLNVIDICNVIIIV